MFEICAIIYDIYLLYIFFRFLYYIINKIIILFLLILFLLYYILEKFFIFQIKLIYKNKNISKREYLIEERNVIYLNFSSQLLYKIIEIIRTIICMNYNIHVLFTIGKKEWESDLSNQNIGRKIYFHTHFCLHLLACCLLI